MALSPEAIKKYYYPHTQDAHDMFTVLQELFPQREVRINFNVNKYGTTIDLWVYHPNGGEALHGMGKRFAPALADLIEDANLHGVPVYGEEE